MAFCRRKTISQIYEGFWDSALTIYPWKTICHVYLTLRHPFIKVYPPITKTRQKLDQFVYILIQTWRPIRLKEFLIEIFVLNRYRRKRPKVDASIFDAALSYTGRSDASEKREKNSVSTFGRFRLWTSFESSPVSVNHLRHAGRISLGAQNVSNFVVPGILQNVAQAKFCAIAESLLENP